MTKIKCLGIPYMGSKRKLSYKIFNKIMKNNSNTKYIYDLFGGGGSFSFYAIQDRRIKKVVYNELNTGIVEFIKHIKYNGITEEMYKFIDKNTFDKYKNNNDWFGGFVKCIYSFGNNQGYYLFGKHKENDKKLLHNIVVYDDVKSLNILNKKYNLNLKIIKSNSLFGKENINNKRIKFIKQINKNSKLSNYNINRLQHLEGINLLNNLSKINLDFIEIINKSYEKVEINTPIDETIIYLDPPYEKCCDYQLKIDYIKLNEYINNSKYKIYISSYEFKNLRCVLEIKHNSILKKNRKVIEKLFVNKNVLINNEKNNLDNFIINL